MEGWVKIHRKIRGWEWYDDLPVRVLFLHLLLSVEYQNTSYKGIAIPKGSRLCGRQTLASETGLSEKAIRRAQKVLEKGQEIGIKRAGKYTMISITKWDDYQQQGQKKGSKRATLKEDKNTRSQEIDLLGDKPPCKPDHVLVKDALACVIGEELAQDVFDHRKKLKKPLTVRAAEGLAKKFAKWHNPQEAAEAMVTNGWQGFDPEWMKNKARGGSQGNFGMMDALIENERRRQSGQANDGPRYIENPFTGEMEEVKT